MTHTHPLTIDILIPALNEAEALPFVLEPLRALKGDLQSLSLSGARLRHVVVIDNGSIDQTSTVALSLGADVILEPQRGYGAACLAGIKKISASPPDVVVFLDADGSDDLGDLDPLVALLSHSLNNPPSGDRERLLYPTKVNSHSSNKEGEACMVIGSRARFASPGALTPLQLFGNALSCSLLKMIFGARFTDLGPFRAIRWETLMSLEMRDQTYGWTVEMQAKACAQGVLCAERDVTYHPRRAGESKVSGRFSASMRAGVKILWTIGAAWWRQRAGR